ncbi:MAG: glycosyltransferase family 2 protein [Candidatus Dadabacteria bacterium]|nr:MAG: glycosyltransferase family 2 protein [Candidatus Dadabacteria bacterium]
MISIVIPIYNEAPILNRTVGKIEKYLERVAEEYEIILVDNGSTDDTPATAREIQARTDSLRYFRIAERAPGRAFVLGVQNARSEKIVSLDADLSSDIAFISHAASLLDYADMVIGSKTLGKQKRNPIRIIGSALYILIAQLVFGISENDFSMGSKAYRRSAILEALDSIDPWTGYVLELILHLKRRGSKIIQISVECEDTRESKFNICYEGLYRYLHLYRCWRRKT